MSNIRHPLELIRSRLNEYIQNAVPRTDEWVTLSNVLNNDGQPNEDARNKVVMFLANIQNDTTISIFNRNVPIQGNQYAIVTPPLYINLYVLFYANFQERNYAEGLGIISRTISFFQQNPVFTHDTLPDLESHITKLTFELTNLDSTGLSYLMSLAGVKYLPSVYYRVRMIPFQGNAMQGQTPAVQGLETPGEPKD